MKPPCDRAAGLWSAGLWFWRNLCTKTTQSIRVLAGGRPLHPSPALPGPGALPRVGRLPRRRPGPLLCPDFSEVQAASMGRPRAKLSKSRETLPMRGEAGQPARCGARRPALPSSPALSPMLSVGRHRARPPGPRASSPAPGAGPRRRPSGLGLVERPCSKQARDAFLSAG